MKDRLPSLDGLRGLAAISVVLSHFTNTPLLLLNVPFLLTAYQMLAVGPNSVQILFVLSGFLMAFLYPSIPKASIFIHKRYARIFPIYGVVVVFLWLSLFIEMVTKSFVVKVAALLLFAVLISYSWKLLKKLKGYPIAWILFWSFVGLQVLVLLFNFFITPRFIVSSQLLLPENIKGFLIMLTNLTLTTPFIKDIPRMSGVFWSLAPEILFYIVYPFIVVPLIQLGRKFGIIAGVLIVVGVTKILFDLDNAIVSLAGLQSMNIARASGFVAGVTVGTLYLTKGTYWKRIESFVTHWFAGIIALILFLGVQWGDSAIRDGQSIAFMNSYYAISSWIIAFVILTALKSQTITYKIFSSKVLVFLGLISYSLYLTHVQSIEWARQAFAMLHINFLSPALAEMGEILIAVVFSIGIAWFLFHFIERLYFAGKKPVIATTLAAEKEKRNTVQEKFSKRFVILTVSFTLLSLLWFYGGSYPPTQLLQRVGVSSHSLGEVALVQQPMAISFTAAHNNLSALYVHLRYAKSADKTLERKGEKAQLVFTLLDEKGKKLFTSKQNAYIVEGSPIYGFGFPQIPDSQNKTYRAVLSHEKGSPTDQIFVDTSSTSFVTVSPASKSELLHNPFQFVANRVFFIFTSPQFLFALFFVFAIAFAYPISEALRKKRP